MAWPEYFLNLFLALLVPSSILLSMMSPFDNILAIQEPSHSLEQDWPTPPRMLMMIDIEKAYDALECYAILATLARMSFPPIWISWVKACITSPSFAFLINSQPTKWINASCGIRQGDPLSPYLFIIGSQNLTAILNHALVMNLVPVLTLESLETSTTSCMPMTLF